MYSFGVLVRELLRRKAASPEQERAPLERLRDACLLPADRRRERPSAFDVLALLRSLRPVSALP